MIGHQGRRVGGTRLVSMHAVTHVHDDWHFGEVLGWLLAGIAELEVLLSNLLQARQVLGRRNGEHDEGSRFMGTTDLFELHPITLLGEGLQVAHQLIVAEVPLPDFMPNDG